MYVSLFMCMNLCACEYSGVPAAEDKLPLNFILPETLFNYNCLSLEEPKGTSTSRTHAKFDFLQNSICSKINFITCFMYFTSLFPVFFLFCFPLLFILLWFRKFSCWRSENHIKTEWNFYSRLRSMAGGVKRWFAYLKRNISFSWVEMYFSFKFYCI